MSETKKEKSFFEKLKSFALEDDGSSTSNQQEKSEKSEVKFSQSSSFPTTPPNTFPSSAPIGGASSVNPHTMTNEKMCEQHMGKFEEMYQKGFEDLNQSGYDFYEFYQSVLAGGPSNPSAYDMAFNMGKVMDKTLSKEKLLTQSEFYVNEVNKVHSNYVSAGNTKRTEISNKMNSEESTLKLEVESLSSQIESLQKKLETKKSELSNIHGKYSPQIAEVDCKLMANDIAKDKIINSIETVRQGIQSSTNIK